MENEIYWRVFLGFFIILSCLGALVLVLRYTKLGQFYRGASSRDRRLSCQEILYLDAKHRLVLIKRDHVEHLLLLGPTNATVVEQSITSSRDESTS